MVDGSGFDLVRFNHRVTETSQPTQTSLKPEKSVGFSDKTTQMFPFIQVPKSFNSKTETGACLINNLSGKLRLFGLFWVTFCLFFFFLGSFQLQQQRLYLCPNSSHLLTGLSGRPLFKRVSCYNKSRVAFLLLFQLFFCQGPV